MGVKKRRLFLPRVAMLVFIAIVFVYTGYHIANLFFTEEIKTIISGVTTEGEYVSGTGYVFRDETLLSSESAGAVDYFVKDGEKISANQEIANLYEVSSEKEGALAKRMLFLTDKQIEILEKSTISGAEAVDLSSLRDEAGDNYFKILELLADRNTSELNVQVENMMTVTNKMSVLADGNSTVSASLAMLKLQREKYLTGSHVSLTASRSGYFYYTPDGFESKFNTAVLDELTADEFYSLVHYYETANLRISDTVYGKLADTTRWNFVIPISQKKAERFEINKEYKLTFKENNNTTLAMTLKKTVDASAKGETILVFECNRLPENFSLGRCQNAQIELSSVEGIYVPFSAIERVDGLRGVYVLRGGVVYFRKVDIIYRGVDYCIVAENGEDEGDYKYLGTNELIITNGKNLFDGRILG